MGNAGQFLCWGAFFFVGLRSWLGALNALADITLRYHYVAISLQGFRLIRLGLIRIVWLGDAAALAGFFVGGADVVQTCFEHLAFEHEEEAFAIASPNHRLVVSFR